jgi:hypothetical protein
MDTDIPMAMAMATTTTIKRNNLHRLESGLIFKPFFYSITI